MKIQLNQANIQTALTSYLQGRGLGNNGEQINITFKPGRKGNGLSAEVTIGDEAEREVKPSAIVQGNPSDGKVKTAKPDTEANQHQPNTDPDAGTEVTTTVNKTQTAKAQALQNLGHEGLENATDVVVEPVTGVTPVEDSAEVPTEKKPANKLFS